VIDPEEFPLGDKTYILSRFPAVAGREIVAKYPVSNMPKIGEYEVSEATMLKLMAHVGVKRDGADTLMLTTKALVDNHVDGWENLARLEWAMMEKNCSFFANGRASTFFEGLAPKIQALISKTLMDLSGRSSAPDSPPSTS
jgi:hypothetical protein